jgi:hypothetical protein
MSEMDRTLPRWARRHDRDLGVDLHQVAGEFSKGDADLKLGLWGEKITGLVGG